MAQLLLPGARWNREESSLLKHSNQNVRLRESSARHCKTPANAMSINSWNQRMTLECFVLASINRARPWPARHSPVSELHRARLRRISFCNIGKHNDILHYSTDGLLIKESYRHITHGKRKFAPFCYQMGLDISVGKNKSFHLLPRRSRTYFTYCVCQPCKLGVPC